MAKKRKSSKIVGEGSGSIEKKGQLDDPLAPMMTSEPVLGASELPPSLVDDSQALVLLPTQSVGGLEAEGETSSNHICPPSDWVYERSHLPQLVLKGIHTTCATT